ncbi:hypothetical protein [Thiomonas sp.]
MDGQDCASLEVQLSPPEMEVLALHWLRTWRHPRSWQVAQEQLASGWQEAVCAGIRNKAVLWTLQEAMQAEGAGDA